MLHTILKQILDYQLYCCPRVETDSKLSKIPYMIYNSYNWSLSLFIFLNIKRLE